MATVTNLAELTRLINTFREIEEEQAISPESLGALLQSIANLAGDRTFVDELKELIDNATNKLDRAVESAEYDKARRVLTLLSSEGAELSTVVFPEATDKVAGLMPAQDKAAISNLGRSFGDVPMFKFDRVLFNEPDTAPDEVGCSGGELALFLNADYTVAKVCVCNTGASKWVTLPIAAEFRPDDENAFPIPDAVTLWSKPASPGGPADVARYLLRPNSLFVISGLITVSSEIAPADGYTALMLTGSDGTPLPLIATRTLAAMLADVQHVAESGQLIDVHELTFNDGNPFGSLQEALDALDDYRRAHDFYVAPGAVIRFSLQEGDGPERWVSYQWRYGFYNGLDDDITIAGNWEPFVPRVQDTRNGAPGQYIYSENNPESKASVLNAPDTFVRQLNGHLMMQKGLWNPENASLYYSRNNIPGATTGADGVLTKEVFNRLGTGGVMYEGTVTSTSVPVSYPNWASGGARTFTLNPATSARAGVMTAADKRKLDALPDAAEIEAGKRALFVDLWRAWDGTLTDAGQFVKFGVEMDYEKAVRVYGMRELIDRVAVAGATFDAQTELFALNGVDDLTREDMELIDREWLLHQGGAPTSKLVQSRTNYALTLNSTSQGFYNFQAPNMEVLRLPSTSYPIAFTGWLSASHPKLRRIMGTIDLTYFTNPSNMNNGLNCPNLTDVNFSRVKVDFNIGKLASISLESLSYLVSDSANGSTAITVTVHADVYAKLTDEANAEWFALLGAAAARNISFATTSAS